MMGEREWRQPGFSADDPALIGRHELVGCIEAAETDFHFVGAAPEHGRSAARAEMPAGERMGFAVDLHRILWEDRGCVKERAVMLAAIHAVAEADAIGAPGGDDTDVAAEAGAGDFIHGAPSRNHAAIRRCTNAPLPPCGGGLG